MMKDLLRPRVSAAARVSLLRGLRVLEAQVYRLRRSVMLSKRERARVKDIQAYRPVFHPWEIASVRRELRVCDARSEVSADRKYILVQLLRNALRTCAGDVAECGVYKGGTAYLLAQTIAHERTLYLLDTFSGMPETHAGIDLHQQGDFSDTSLAAVQWYLRSFDALEFVVGKIPATLADLPRTPFCFVHVDLDIHDAILAASEFFYPLLAPGGCIVYDDYGFASCPGARQAVDTFYTGRREVPLILPTGQCLIFKAASP